MKARISHSTMRKENAQIHRNNSMYLPHVDDDDSSDVDGIEENTEISPSNCSLMLHSEK